MIYPKDFEQKIGFSSIRELLAGKCESHTAKELTRQMSFSGDFSEVKRRLLQTSEMLSLLGTKKALPVDAVHDIGQSLTLLRSEGNYLVADKLHQLSQMLETLGRLGRFFSTPESRSNMPELAELFGNLMGFPQVVSEIDRCVDRHGEVKDNASEALLKVRRAIKAATGSVQSSMRAVYERAKQSGIIDRDTQPTVRDGRLVLAVPAEKRRQLSGIMHDESASGKTVFIEPLEVVEASNRIRELSLEEHREVVEIFKGIAATIRGHIDEIAAESLFLYLFDFIRAKALVAMDMDAHMPVIERIPEFDWFHAIHPGLLLTLRSQGKEVVPLDLKLDKDRRILIISGPNAGGKSVALKTIGVIQYMTQCGMLPTVYSNSHIGVFHKLMADIGDEQSMENDLSTYSSHLRNMKTFLANADSNTLILADEMGSGTEPQIGGALAQSILERLGQTGCYAIVTTHFQNLKTMADDTPGFVNGAMMYDRQHLQPTFQLSVGSPGSSFALEIARNIGLPFEVVEKAKEIVGTDYVNSDRYLLDIARDRRYWANKRKAIREKEAKLDSLLVQYESKSSDLKKQRAEILNEARHEARELMKGANARIEKTIREIKSVEAEKERTRGIRRELEEYKTQLNNEAGSKDSDLPELLREQRHKSKAKRIRHREEEQPADIPLQPGDYVRMSDGGVSGRIMSINAKKAEVAFGSLRTYVELNRLKRASAPKPTALSQPSVMTAASSDAARERQLNFKQEIDVRGMRADEAIQAVTYFIDDAVQFGASRLRILHGTGHGILKTLIRQQLDINKSVKKYADEDVRFGGAGITVVDME